MKKNKKKYNYICENCSHEFYLYNLICNRMVECPRCEEKTAYCDVDNLDDDIDDSGDSDFRDVDFLTGYEYNDNFNF